MKLEDALLNISVEQWKVGEAYSYDWYDGPRGGLSDDGIKDDRLTIGAEITLIIAGDNKTVREVRLPTRGREKKSK